MLYPFLLGTAVGYVLGTRAGRERYEQLSRTYHRVADHPTVQGAAGIVRAKAGELTHRRAARPGPADPGRGSADTR